MSHRRRRVALSVAALVVPALAVSTPGADARADELVTHHLTAMITVNGKPADSNSQYLYRFDVTTGEYEGVLTGGEHGGDAFSYDVTDGVYLLFVQGSGPNPGLPLYASEWYGDTYWRDEATPIVVAGTDVDLGTIDLAIAPQVAVTMTSSGHSASCPDVEWYGKRADGTYELFYRAIHPSQPTYWYFLAPGTYKLLNVDLCDSFPDRWYGDTLDEASALPIVVGTRDIDLEQVDLDPDYVVNVVPPRIGVPGRFRPPMAVGAYSGEWAPQGVSLEQVWLVDGVEVGRGPSYRLRNADVGHRLVLAVTGRRGDGAVTVRAPAVDVPRLSSRTRLRVQHRRRLANGAVAVTLSAMVLGPEGPGSDGVVRFLVDGRRVANRDFSGSNVRKTVVLSPGEHRLRVRFIGSERWRSSGDAATYRA